MVKIARKRPPAGTPRVSSLVVADSGYRVGDVIIVEDDVRSYFKVTRVQRSERGGSTTLETVPYTPTWRDRLMAVRVRVRWWWTKGVWWPVVDRVHTWFSNDVD